jgi:membrane-bound metal-dependent hydrolase YbcI (DUF457 family)
MHLETHLAIGWALANLFPGLSRRQRLLVTLAGALPDADGLSYLAGEMAYSNWHHTVGHNVFTSGVVLLFAAILAGRKRLVIILATQLAFWCHLAGDYLASGWAVELLWPLRREGWMFHPRIGLDHPVNVILSYASWAFMAASWWIWRRTPLEFAWPKLDALVARAVHPATLRCDLCGEPMALRRGRVLKGLRLACQDCAKGATPVQRD